MASDNVKLSDGDEFEPLADLGDLEELELDLDDTRPDATHDAPTAADDLPAAADDLPATISEASEELPQDEEGASEAASLLARGIRIHDAIMGMGAFGFSMVFHVILLVVLGLMIFEDATKAAVQTLVASAFEERPEDEIVEIELNEQIETVEEQTAMLTSAAVLGATGPVAPVAGSVTLDTTVVERAEATNLVIDAPTIGIPDSMGLIEAVPDGDVKGDPRAIVDNYQQAFDQITQEIMWMLDKGPVLVSWCFDQSESMKDDQQEIRDRVANVYNQLGITGTNSSDTLLTAVTSYGAGYAVHTERGPTSNREEIVRAIDAVPIDNSGKEMMCQAVGRTIALHRRYATRGRQMAIILVTDESGDRDNNDRFLEDAIKEAKSAKAKIYVLGRESVFGYPYAFIRWRHPQTRRVHWLRIDRGPETGFPEQLQTNGFHRRHDAFSSGFGPYEECRMSRETNGVFFMLPSVERNLVRAQKQHYAREALRPFLPDLRARQEVLLDRDQYPLRTLIWKVTSDLNPYNPAARDVVELKVEFPLTRPEFVQAATQNQQKAILLLRYMAEAEKALVSGKSLRDQEADPRWQANYDLIHAQLVAYQARIYEYGAALEDFKRNFRTAVPTKGDLVLVHWDVHTRKDTRTEESKPYIDRSSSMLKTVNSDFPGTPWAARAAWEVQRGFGVDFRPDYHEPYRDVPNAIQPPKL